MRNFVVLNISAPYFHASRNFIVFLLVFGLNRKITEFSQNLIHCFFFHFIYIAGLLEGSNFLQPETTTTYNKQFPPFSGWKNKSHGKLHEYF